MWRAVLLAALCCIGLVHAVNYEGTHFLTGSWKYVARFCFEEGNGKYSRPFRFFLGAPVDSNTKILLYFNKDNSARGFNNFAKDVYESDLTCQQKVAAADFILYPAHADKQLESYCEGRDEDCDEKYWYNRDRKSYQKFVDGEEEDTAVIFNSAGTLPGEGTFHTSRDRWFFVALANCKMDQALMIRSDLEIPVENGVESDEDCPNPERDFCDSSIRAWLRLEFRNGDRVNDYDQKNLYYHISADEADILPTDIAFFIAQTLLVAYVSYVSCLLVSMIKWHYTVRLLVLSITFQWLGILFEMIYYAHLSYSGTEVRGLNTTGLAFTAIAEQLFLFMLILVAKGWTIVRAKISASGRMKLAMYMTVYTLVNFAMIGWWHQHWNSAAVVYIYDSEAGKVLVIMRVFAFIWFVYCCQTTATNYDKKKAFYSKFQICFGLWILSMPIFAAIALLIDDHTRAEFMNVAELLLLFFGQATLAYMYNPRANCNQSFPFHASTNDLMKPKRLRRERSSVESTAQTVGAANGGDGADGSARPKLHSSHPGAGGSAGGGGNVRYDGAGIDRVKVITIVLQKKLGVLREYAEDLITAVQDLEAEQDDYDEDFDDMDDMRSKPRVQRGPLPQGFQAPEAEMQTFGRGGGNRPPADEWTPPPNSRDNPF